MVSEASFVTFSSGIPLSVPCTFFLHQLCDSDIKNEHVLELEVLVQRMDMEYQAKLTGGLRTRLADPLSASDGCL